jgi:hypothetical protein
MAEHFGDQDSVPNGACGICEVCVNGPLPDFGGQRWIDFDPEQFQKCYERCHFRTDPRLLARFAFGLTWPKLTRARLTNREVCTEFGSMEGCSWEELLDACQQVCERDGYQDQAPNPPAPKPKASKAAAASPTQSKVKQEEVDEAPPAKRKKLSNSKSVTIKREA